MLNLNFRQQVFAGFFVSVILVLTVGILSYRSINQLEEDTGWVEHSQNVIKTSSSVLQLMVDAETGVRGYVAIGNKQFLDPYNAALPRINLQLGDLKQLVADNPQEVRNVDTLSSFVNNQLVLLKDIIETRDTKGLQYIADNHLLLNGKHNMDGIRGLNARISLIELKLLKNRKASSEQASRTTLIIILAGSLVFFAIIIFMFRYIQGTFDRQKKIERDINQANTDLERVLAENEAKNWLLTGAGALNEKMQGQQTERELGVNLLTEVCSYTNALAGTIYLFDENKQQLDLCATYAFSDLDAVKKTVRLSEGALGQVAQDERASVVRGKINNKIAIETSIIYEELTETFIVPFFFDKRLKGVMEIAFNGDLKDHVRDYILSVAKDIGVAVNTAQARTIMHDLLEETRQQSEELEAQQEELRVTNEELVNKTEMLQSSEEELRMQQEELRTINAELEEKASLLEEKNQAIELQRQAIDNKARELETTGRYKSEFLANMSHELRTPLNSILVLARILKDNKANNLSDDQIKYASVIFNAGNDLLTLINDILDLSKIESGKLDMQYEHVELTDILHDMEMLFAEMAKNKNINYTTSIEGTVKTINTDKVRVEQVLKNLLSNAFKFTPESGSIGINIKPGKESGTLDFCIKDTGIGIPFEKQKLIFEAFQQADGSTSRKYGGTGLGLSISRELALLLGGHISLTSQPGEGSEFILTLPVTAPAPVTVVDEPFEILPSVQTFNPQAQILPASQPKMNRAQPLVVIVEDDKNFADILNDYSKQHGYSAVLVHDGAVAFDTIKEKMPDAVILDIMLPGKDGWQILKELKNDSETAHIPVHLMSAGDAAANRVKREGAISFLKKPIKTDVLDKLFTDMRQTGVQFTQILLVEDHEAQSQALKEMMQSQGITVDQAYDGESAMKMLHEKTYQCVILDLNLPDISGLDLLDKIKADDDFAALPVIVNTAMELDKTSVNRLMKYANAMVVKTSKSSDRLIDEVNLFLNKVSSTAPKPLAAPATQKIRNVSDKNIIKGKKVLIVDDDMRNIFALSSALQQYDMVVEIANDGEESLEKLENISNIDIVLMDIMMPKMDGYDAMRHIRKQIKWAKLPIIALTAKAMKDDKEKCIEAGASDYITKPVDMDRLIAMMQLWLEK